MRIFLVLFISLMTVFAQAETFPFQRELSQLAQMKTRHLIQTIQKRVDLYRFKKDGMNPKLIEGLSEVPEMSPGMYQQFKRDILFGAAGIYLSARDIRFGVKRPTIILREDATSWVLIHEYTHFLLDEARHTKKEVNFDDSLTLLEDNLNGFAENLASYKAAGNKFRDHQHESETGASLITASELRIKLMRIYELEEIAIESSLRKIYESGIGHTLDLEDYENSEKYIQTNKNSVRRGLSFLHDSILELDQAWSHSEIRSALVQIRDQLSQVMQFVLAS